MAHLTAQGTSEISPAVKKEFKVKPKLFYMHIYTLCLGFGAMNTGWALAGNAPTA